MPELAYLESGTQSDAQSAIEKPDIELHSTSGDENTTPSETEKGAVRDGAVSGLGSGTWSVAATRKLRHKLDIRLIPFLSLLYLCVSPSAHSSVARCPTEIFHRADQNAIAASRLSFLDRTNIGNGKLADLEKDLHMDPASIKFNIAIAIFFPFYVVAEIPSNLAMKRFRPSIWIPSIMVAWGACCIGMGFVKNYEGLLFARSVMGFAEGGLFPGVTY